MKRIGMLVTVLGLVAATAVALLIIFGMNINTYSDKNWKQSTPKTGRE